MARVGRLVPDATALLTLYLVLVLAIPSNRMITVLGAAGSVGVIFGLGAAILWAVYRIQRAETASRLRPVRAVLFGFLLLTLGSYVVAMTRALPADDVTVADTGMIRLLAWAGVLLLAHDGISSIGRLLVLLRRLVIAGGILAALGITQFLTRASWVDLLTFPGLDAGDEYAAVETRGGLVRAAGTSTHPLEYALVLAMVFPIALTLALRETRRPAVARWLPVGLILLALALSGSRSALIGVVAGAVMLIPTWSGAVRWRLALAGVVLLGGVYALNPQVVNNLRYLFQSIFDDPSATSRSDSFGLFRELFLIYPILGRGFGTFLPQYRILDNQYLLFLLELGVVGLLAFLVLCATAIGSVLSTGRRTIGYSGSDPLIHDVGFALAGSIVAGAVLLALFDALAFPQSAGLLFLMLGLCGAYWRLAGPTETALVRVARREAVTA